MRRRLLILVVAVVSLGSACTRGIEQAAEILQSPSITPSISTSQGPSVASPSEAPIEVRTPRRGDDVLSPLVVSGTAISPTGEVVVDILDAQGTELAAMKVEVDCGPSCRGGFRARLAFYVTTRQEGTVEVYEVGPGGVGEHLVEVDVTLVPGV